MAGNCGFGALVRFGGGDLRSLVVVVVIGIFAFVTLSGPLAPLRAALFPQGDATGTQGIAHWLSARIGLPPLFFALPVGALAIGWALSHAPLRHKPAMIAWGAAAGLAVVWAFVGTTWLWFGCLTVAVALLARAGGRADGAPVAPDHPPSTSSGLSQVAVDAGGRR